MNFLPAIATGPASVRVAGHDVRVPGLSTELPPEQPLQVGIRPEHLTAVDGVEVPMTIEVVEQLGAWLTSMARSRRMCPWWSNGARGVLSWATG
jgi:ABC-type sugar transport system ATPase subunit